jgi:hypothetical protein
MRLGFIVILTGVVYLLKNTGLITNLQFHLLWPIFVMLIGISITLRSCYECGRYGCDGMHGKMKKGKRGKLCSCDCDTCQNCETK